MRERVFERLGEIRKRNEGEKLEEKKVVIKRRRRLGGDIIEWLRERVEVDLEIKK